jgi:hypothetical protein
MIGLLYFLVLFGAGIFVTALGIVAHDVYTALQLNGLLQRVRHGNGISYHPAC